MNKKLLIKIGIVLTILVGSFFMYKMRGSQRILSCTESISKKIQSKKLSNYETLFVLSKDKTDHGIIYVFDKKIDPNSFLKMKNKDLQYSASFVYPTIKDAEFSQNLKDKSIEPEVTYSVINGKIFIFSMYYANRTIIGDIQPEDICSNKKLFLKK